MEKPKLTVWPIQYFIMGPHVFLKDYCFPLPTSWLVCSDSTPWPSKTGSNALSHWEGLEDEAMMWAQPAPQARGKGTLPHWRGWVGMYGSPWQGCRAEPLLAVSQLPMSRVVLTTQLCCGRESEMPRHRYVIRGQHSKITSMIQMLESNDKTD